MIAPCVHTLCELAKQVHQMFGSHQSIKHMSPNLQWNIDCLMVFFEQYRYILLARAAASIWKMPKC